MMGSLREMGKGGGNRAGSEGPYEGRGIEKPRAKSAAVGKTLQETIFFKINKKDKSPRIKKENLLIVERRKFRVWIHKRREPKLRRDVIGIQLTLIDRNTV
jgi:hypothetical protein